MIKKILTLVTCLTVVSLTAVMLLAGTVVAGNYYHYTTPTPVLSPTPEETSTPEPTFNPCDGECATPTPTEEPTASPSATPTFLPTPVISPTDDQGGSGVSDGLGCATHSCYTPEPIKVKELAPTGSFDQNMYGVISLVGLGMVYFGVSKRLKR